MSCLQKYCLTVKKLIRRFMCRTEYQLYRIKYAAEAAFIAYTKDKYFDYYGFYYYLDFKLKHFMLQEKKENPHCVRLRSYRSARLTRTMLKRIFSNRANRPIDRVYEKYGEQEFWFTPIQTNDKGFSSFHLDWKKSLTPKQRLQVREEEIKAYKTSDRLAIRDHRVLMDLINHYLKTWWI
jgi:hypothetical protein